MITRSSQAARVRTRMCIHVTARVQGQTITAVRLEVMADPSLPQGGPGRQGNGNLHLTEFV